MEENIKKIQALIISTQAQYRTAGVQIWFVAEGLRPGTGGWLAAGFGVNGQVSGPGNYKPTPEEAVAELVPIIERYAEYYQ